MFLQLNLSQQPNHQLYHIFVPVTLERVQLALRGGGGIPGRGKSSGVGDMKVETKVNAYHDLGFPSISVPVIQYF